MASQNTRKESDLRNLMKNGYKVEMINDNVDQFIVFLEGPPDSLYSEGVWKVKVQLPEDYPLKPPSIFFKTKIYHPNIHSKFGNVCMDVLKERGWIPSCNLLMVFEHFLPQILTKPNAEDPLYKEAAALLIRDKASYEATVKDVDLSSGNEGMAAVLVRNMRQRLQFVFPHETVLLVSLYVFYMLS